MALAVATPIALVYPNLPCDVILSTVFPLHAYVGLHAVVTDYVPPPFKVIKTVHVLFSIHLNCAGCWTVLSCRRYSVDNSGHASDQL